MSKLLTIYNVMKEMKKTDVKKGTFELEVSSNGDNIVKLSNEFEFDMDIHKNKINGFQSHGMMDMGFGPRHFHHHKFNLDNMDDIPEEFKKVMNKHEEKLQELGFTKDEIEEFKSVHQNAMDITKIGKLDRLMMMIKLLDKTNLIENNNKKVLSLDIEINDLPEEFMTMMEHKKNHMQLMKRFMEKIKDSDIDIESFHEGLKDEHFKKKHEVMKELKSSLDKAGIVIETLQPESMNLRFEINDKDQIEKAIITIDLVDEEGKNIIIKALKSSLN